jgi:hypothetical protein
MTTHNPEREADALEAYLQGALPADHPDLPAAEAELGLALKSAAQEIQPPAQFEAELERSLMREAQRKPSRLQRGLASTGRTAAWAALAIVLLLGLGWVFRTLLPGTAPGAGPTGTVSAPATLPTASQTPPATQSAGPEEPTPAPIQPAGLTTFRLPMLQDVEVALQAELPEAPSKVQIYRQKAWPALSPEMALQTASQLGVEGQLYLAPAGPPGATSYLVSDGYARVLFQQAAPWYQYQAAPGGVPPAGSELPPEQAQAASEAFLKTHGLDQFEYHIEARPGGTVFAQTLDGIPLSFPPFDEPQVRLVLDDQGQVVQVNSSLLDFEALDSYPIISAGEAWEKVLSPDTLSGSETYSISGGANAFHSWGRTYPSGQDVELFGTARAYPALDPSQPPLIFLMDFPVSGNIQGLAEAAESNRFIQAWGQFVEDGQGRRSFQMTGWQASFFPDQNLQGTLERQGGEVYLVTPDQRLRLPDAPADLPDGATIAVQGVVLEEPELAMEWSNLYTAPLGGGGGGGGGTGFAQLNLEGPPATLAGPAQTEPTPTPVVSVGQRLEAVQGQVMIFITQYSEGPSVVEAMLDLDPSLQWPEGLRVKLDGPGLAGIEAYHNLPVRVWGEISDASTSLSSLSLERYEPVYPEVKVEAWLGMLDNVTLGDQQVQLFTAQDGKQYVLNSSIENPGLDELPGAATDPVVVEGILIPEQALANYPVITDFAVMPMPGTNDLSEYQPMSASPVIIHKQGSAGERGQAVIDQIELVYYTADPRYAGAEVQAAPAYAQPAWRFSGHYEDGATFVILVQALRPEYLK